MTKVGEIFSKKIINFIKRAEDHNISAMEPVGYSTRYVNHVKNCIEEEQIR